MATYSDLHSTLLRRINTLLDGRLFYTREEYRRVLSRVLLDFFPMLKWLSEVAGGQEDVNSLFERFKRLYRLGEGETLRATEYAKRDISEFEDEINYLKICVKNTCNVDLDTVDSEALGREEALRPTSFGRSRRARTNSEYAYENFLGDFEDSLGGSGMRGFFVQARARAKLETKIMSGEIYIFKTKPRRNLVIKGILATIWFAGLGFVTAVLLNGIFGRTSLTPITLPSIAFFLLFFVFNLLFLFRNMKNENFKYSFPKRPFFTTFFWFFIFVIVMLSSQDQGAGFLEEKTNKVAWLGTFLSVISSFILYLAAFLYLQPEEDRELMERLMREDISDSSESPSADA